VFNSRYGHIIMTINMHEAEHNIICTPHGDRALHGRLTAVHIGLQTLAHCWTGSQSFFPNMSAVLSVIHAEEVYLFLSCLRRNLLPVGLKDDWGMIR
jgi:hypothetical protein